MLNIPNIKELNGLAFAGFTLSHCQYIERGSNLVREPHYQIQFDKIPPIGKARTACLTIQAEGDYMGRYFCKLFYGTTDNVIWQEWLVIDVLRKRDNLLNSMGGLIQSHINRTT